MDVTSEQHCVPERPLTASLERFREDPGVESFCTQPSGLQRFRSAQRYPSSHTSASSVGAAALAELAEPPQPGRAAYTPRRCWAGHLELQPEPGLPGPLCSLNPQGFCPLGKRRPQHPGEKGSGPRAPGTRLREEALRLGSFRRELGYLCGGGAETGRQTHTHRGSLLEISSLKGCPVEEEILWSRGQVGSRVQEENLGGAPKEVGFLGKK